MSLFKIFNSAETDTGPAVIEIYEEIGKNWWTNEGLGAKEFSALLAGIPNDRELVVAINSVGGNVADGLAIYNMLKRRGNVTTRCDGIAASIASVIFQAGTVREMPANALVMIHNPWSVSMGDADQMRKDADSLDKHKDSLISIYHEATGLSRERLSAMMDAETWMTGEEAAELNFCDGATEPMQIAASIRHPSAFQFRNTPKSAATASVQQPQQEQHMEPTASTAAPVATPAPAPAPTIDHAQLAASIAALLKPAPGAEPVPPVTTSVQNLGNSAMEIYLKMENGPARAAFRSANNQHLVEARLNEPERAALQQDLLRSRFSPQNANTIASGLINDVMADGVYQAVHNRLALLPAILANFSGDPMKPKVPVDIMVAGSTSATQVNATDFETGSTTLAVSTVSPAQYSQCFEMPNVDIQNGFRLQQVAFANALTMADTLHDAATTLMVAANFGSVTIGVGTAATWTGTTSLITQLAPVLAAAKNYDRKVLLMDGGHLAYLLPTATTSLNYEANGAFGFDQIISNSRWTGAQANTVGFISNGRSIAAVSGVPFEVAQGQFQTFGTAVLKNGLTIVTRTWFSYKTRTLWGSYDIVFGAKVIDGTGGRVLVTV